MGDYIQALLMFLISFATIIGAYWKLNNETQKKADKEIMAKELEKINLNLQKLFDKMDIMEKKIDELKAENECYSKKLEELEKNFTILNTRYENGKTVRKRK